MRAAGINTALISAPGIEVVTASGNSSFPDAEVVICDYDSGVAWAHTTGLCEVAATLVAKCFTRTPLTMRKSEMLRPAAVPRPALKVETPARRACNQDRIAA